MLAKSGNDTFAICLYADGLMEWTFADRIRPFVTVGYSIEAQRPSYEYFIPGAESCSMYHIASRSNVNIPGLFVFHLKHGTEPYFGIFTEIDVDIFNHGLISLQCQCVKREMYV